MHLVVDDRTDAVRVLHSNITTRIKVLAIHCNIDYLIDMNPQQRLQLVVPLLTLKLSQAVREFRLLLEVQHDHDLVAHQHVKAPSVLAQLVASMPLVQSVSHKASSRKDTLTHRPHSMSPTEGPARDTQCHNFFLSAYLPACLCYCEGSSVGVLDFAEKRAPTPPSKSTPGVAFWERGRGPTTPSRNACDRFLHMQTSCTSSCLLFLCFCVELHFLPLVV